MAAPILTEEHPLAAELGGGDDEFDALVVSYRVSGADFEELGHRNLGLTNKMIGFRQTGLKKDPKKIVVAVLADVDK